MSDTAFVHDGVIFDVLEVLASCRLSGALSRKMLSSPRWEDVILRDFKLGIPGKADVAPTYYSATHPARIVALADRISAMLYPTGLIVCRGHKCSELQVRDGARQAAQVAQQACSIIASHSDPSIDNMVISTSLPAVRAAMDADFLWMERTAARCAKHHKAHHGVSAAVQQHSLKQQEVVYEPELLHGLVCRVPYCKTLLAGSSTANAGSKEQPAATDASGAGAGGHMDAGTGAGASHAQRSHQKSHLAVTAIVTVFPDGRVGIHGCASRAAAILAYEWVKAKLIDRNDAKAAALIAEGLSAIGPVGGTGSSAPAGGPAAMIVPGPAAAAAAASSAATLPVPIPALPSVGAIGAAVLPGMGLASIPSLPPMGGLNQIQIPGFPGSLPMQLPMQLPVGMQQHMQQQMFPGQLPQNFQHPTMTAMQQQQQMAMMMMPGQAGPSAAIPPPAVVPPAAVQAGAGKVTQPAGSDLSDSDDSDDDDDEGDGGAAKRARTSDGT